MRCIILTTLLFQFSVIALAQHNTARLYSEAEAAHNAGRYKEALGLLNECIKENPAFAEAYFTRAAAREQLKDLKGALTDYSIFIELKPENAEGLLSRGRLRYQLEKYDQAKEDFLKLLTLDVGETSTIYYQNPPSASGRNQIVTAQGSFKPLVYNYIGLTEIKLSNFKSAIQWIDSALQSDPYNADYYVNRGIAKEGLDDNTALTDYQKALSIDSNHTIALHNSAVLKRKKGDKSQAEDLEKAIDSDSSMLYPYLERAYQRLEGGYYKGALEDYNKAISIEDKDPEIWLNRGLVKEKLNDLKGAYVDYTQAISLQENFAKAWLNRGNILNKQGRYKEAIEDYTVALTYQNDFGSAYYNRAIAKERLKLLPESCEDLKKAESLGMKVSNEMKGKICRTN